MKRLIIPIFIPHLGCPHTCAFCNQKKIAQKTIGLTKTVIMEKAKLYTETVKNKKLPVEIAFFGGSFTGIPSFLQEEFLGAALELKEQGLIQFIRLSTRPDYINCLIIERLKKYAVDIVELGVQSLEAKILAKSQRGHTVEDVHKALELLKANGLKVGLQLMPGLPDDSFKKILDTTVQVVELKPDFVRIYPTLVIRDTLLEEWYLSGDFQPFSLDEAIEISTKMVIIFQRANIPVIRIGLQAQDNLTEGQDLVAGPYHPAFGELVEARVFRKQIEHLLAICDLGSMSNSLEISCHPKEISQVKGQKKENIHYFHENYYLEIKIVADEKLDKGTLVLTDLTKNIKTVLTRQDFLLEEKLNSCH